MDYSLFNVNSVGFIKFLQELKRIMVQSSLGSQEFFVHYIFKRRFLKYSTLLLFHDFLSV